MNEIETGVGQRLALVERLTWSITGEREQRSIELVDQPAALSTLTFHVARVTEEDAEDERPYLLSIEAYINPEAPMSPAHVAGLIRLFKAHFASWPIAGQAVTWHIHRRERLMRLSEPVSASAEHIFEALEQGASLLEHIVSESKEVAREEAEYFKAQALWGEAERAYRLWHLLDPL